MNLDREPETRVDLAREADFGLGAMLIRPSACRVRLDNREVRVEPRVMQVLVVLARGDGGTVTRDALVEACWDGRIVSDDAVSRIIAKVRVLARLTDPPAFVLETVPKVGFQLIVAVGATPASPTSARPLPAWRRRPLLIGVGALIVLVAAALTWRLWPQIPAHQNGRVDVMAFEATHPDVEIGRLAAAMGPGILRGLAQAGIPTAPAVARKGENGVRGSSEFRIVGSVSRRGEMAVTNAQLLDPRDGVILWSTKSERPIQDRSGFEDAFARHVASVLQCMLEDRQVHPAVLDAAALANYLNGCEAILVGEHHRALEFTRRLLKQRPDLPGPWALNAISLAHIAWATEDVEQAEALRHEARAAARKALKIRPAYAEAYQALAISHPYGRAWAPREAYVLKARALDPNFTPAHLYYISILRETGRLRRASEVASAAAKGADPRVGAVRFLSIQLKGELEGPAATQADLEDLDDPGMGRALKRDIALWQLPPHEGRKALPTLFGPSHPPPYRACLDKHLAAVERAQVRGLPSECERMAPDMRIRMLARQGDIDGAFAEATRQAPAVGYTTVHLFQPELKAFRADRRFMPLAHRLGLVDFWRDTGRWPDFCAEPDLPYECRAAAAELPRAASGKAT